jgi:hypothetical protein
MHGFDRVRVPGDERWHYRASVWVEDMASTAALTESSVRWVALRTRCGLPARHDVLGDEAWPSCEACAAGMWTAVGEWDTYLAEPQ